MVTYLANTFFMLVILLVLWTRSAAGLHQPLSRKRYLWLVGATGAYIVMDALFIVCHFVFIVDKLDYPLIIFQIVAFLFYITYVMMPFFWHIFVRNYVGLTFKSSTRKLECIPLFIQLTLIALTPFTGALWKISAEGGYERGPWFSFFSVLNLFYYAEPLLDAIIIYLRHNQEQERYRRSSVLISLFPLIAVIANTYIIPIYEVYPFQPFCTIIVDLLAYFFIAAKESDLLQQEQQKALEEALRQAQEATERANEASRVKSDFLSTMSHDIRTPMNAIINLTKLAQEEKDMTTVQEYLGKMAVSGNFLLGLINDILDMSKIESGELVLTKDRLSRSEFLTTVETVIHPLIEAKHLHYHPELHPGEYIIMVDKVRFNQIFFNLLSNAVKFTPEGGDIWFEVYNMEVENGKLEIKFVVRDNGIGMSEEFLQHLFEPFAQEHSKLSDKTPGTGLGLPIVKSLVEAMNGTITVKSELGKGTEFTVVFYVDIAERDTAAAHEKKETDSEPKLSGMRVLLVEDNEINTYVAKIILENMECVVTTAANGQEAVDAFSASETNAFDAVLMDVRMPVMDGLEATKEIRALDRPDAKTTPIIAMTAEAFAEERKRTIEAGMNYHLSKPIDAQQLYQVLEKCWKQ